MLFPEHNWIYNNSIDIIKTMSTGNKNRRQIFGEIYTKLRTRATHIPNNKISDYFRSNITNFAKSPVGNEITEIINKAYYSIYVEYNTLTDLEMCVVLAEGCCSDVKRIVNQSEQILLTLEQINNDLCGEEYV